MQINKIVSGGQTGVDRAALDAAREYGVPIGGWCPQGRRAEDGRIPERYPLQETPTEEYAQRTAWNVRDSDGTLVVTAGPLDEGTALTIEEATRQDKPFLHVKTSDPVPIPMIQAWAEENDVQVLNVAGPRASEVQGIYEAARHMMEALLETVRSRGRKE